MIASTRAFVAWLRLWDEKYEAEADRIHATYLDFRTEQAAEVSCLRLNGHMRRLAERDAPHRSMEVWRLDVHDLFSGELLFTWAYADGFGEG